jgi:large subunit ribosomal protein L21
VLLVADGAAVRVGAPTVDGAAVRATVLEQGRGEKVIVFTFKKRKNASRRRGGHRQAYTAVKIEAIEA